jgi:CheY-like chemotaxis protein
MKLTKGVTIMQLEASVNEMCPAESSYLGRILLVDDDTSVLRSLQKTLEFTHPDYLINCAESAEDALDILKSDDVDLLISDLKLPNIDGLSLVSLARNERPRMHSILMTAYGSDEVLNEATENGCIAYLEKPFDLELLIQSVNTALSSTGTDQQPNLATIEVIELYAKSGVAMMLSVSSRSSVGLISLESGFIRHAEFEGSEGLDALMRIVRCPGLAITQISGNKQSLQTLNLSASSLRSLLGLNRSCRAKVSAKPGSKCIPMDSSDPTMYIPGLEQRRKAITDKLVKTGLGYLKTSRQVEAKRCWQKALEIDPYCAEASRNLVALDKILKRIRTRN